MDFVIGLCESKIQADKRTLWDDIAERIALQSVVLISSKLWENRDIIDEFVLSDFKNMNEEETEIVTSWKKEIRGKFIVDRHLKKGSVLVSVDNNEVYIVKGIYTSWREMLESYPMPQIVEATLLPYRDVIIHDGIVVPYRVCLGRNMSEESKQIYLAAKANGNLHYSL